MPYTLRLRGVAVGYSDLEDADPAAGIARGELRPGLGYELVEPIFRLRAEATARPDAPDEEKLRRYRQARAALPLELADACGGRVAVTDVVIIPPPAGGGAPPRLEARVDDPAFWRTRGGGGPSGR